MGARLLARALGERQTVAFDVGHYSVKMVRVLHTSRNQHIVLAADLEPLDEGVIVDCNIQDTEKLHEAVMKLIARNITDSYPVDYTVSINGASGVLVDQMTVKLQKNMNEDALILQTAQTRPPFDDQDNVLDYQVVSKNNEEVNVIVVAAKSAQLNALADFFRSLDKKLSCIDVACFGLANAYKAFASPEESDKTIALFNIGEKKMNSVYLMNGYFHSLRAMTSGALDSVINMLNKHLGIDAKKCHEIFESGDVSCVEGFSEADVEAALQMSYEEIVSAVEFGIRYFSSHEGGEKPVKLYFGGGGAALPNLKNYIAERIGIETDTLNPFKNVVYSSGVVGEKGMSLALSNIYAPALGLAMRKF